MPKDFLDALLWRYRDRHRPEGRFFYRNVKSLLTNLNKLKYPSQLATGMCLLVSQGFYSNNVDDDAGGQLDRPPWR